MRRTISSAQTFFAKVLLVPLYLGLCGYFAVLLFGSQDIFARHPNPPPPEMKWFALAVLAVGCINCWVLARLKSVALDDQNLYVSNFRKEIVIPLRDIRTVTYSRWSKGNPVTIQLARDTDFGNRIVFLPPARWFAFFSAPPVVAELNAAADRARTAPWRG